MMAKYLFLLYFHYKLLRKIGGRNECIEKLMHYLYALIFKKTYQKFNISSVIAIIISLNTFL